MPPTPTRAELATRQRHSVLDRFETAHLSTKNPRGQGPAHSLARARRPDPGTAAATISLPLSLARLLHDFLGQIAPRPVCSAQNSNEALEEQRAQWSKTLDTNRSSMEELLTSQVSQTTLQPPISPLPGPSFVRVSPGMRSIHPHKWQCGSSRPRE